ncbi:hypothetical protein [Streptomyces swartbergensis]|uniref:Tetratricopeptide repeat protein n=1 Tax=Streptomyces swartbergensis TaxID=487165 RepID=A0A243S7S8_9ACTN|nr:hypothetical protein [Streptomyces swartbergensis]OUD03676.1 hypothetical protein CA983_08355 [Streptomyces swartbergensis]
MSDLHTYPRNDDVVWTDLDFRPAVELDTVRLQRIWSAWFTLTPTVGGPLCAESTPLLLALLRDETLDVLPHCSLILQGDARSWLARQTRADAFLGRTPAEVAASTGLEGWRFLSDQVAAWAHQSVPRRAVLIRLLTQLGFYGPAWELAEKGAGSAHPASDYLDYEVARALRQHLRDSTTPADSFARLATDGRTPSLRVLSCTQLISILLRDRDGERGSGYWTSYGEALLPLLAEEDPWVHALTLSRYWRAAAFHRLTGKDTDGARQAMDTASAADEEAGRLAATSQQWHCARENTRLLMDVTVKAGTAVFSADHVTQSAQRLLELDGNEPSARYFLAAWLQRTGDLKGAAEEFERGARLGALRGAGSAYRAVQCYQELGDEDAVARTTRLLLELDPAAHVPEGATR